MVEQRLSLIPILNSTELFGVDIPKNSLIYDRNTNITWEVLRKVLSTESLDTLTLLTEKIQLKGGGYTVVQVSTNYSVNSNEMVLMDISASFNITLPPAPSNGDRVAFVDLNSIAETFPITILRNGNTINNLAEDLSFDVSGATLELVFYNGNWAKIISPSLVTGGGGGSGNIDGGSASSVYTVAQIIDGGNANG